MLVGIVLSVGMGLVPNQMSGRVGTGQVTTVSDTVPKLDLVRTSLVFIERCVSSSASLVAHLYFLPIFEGI